MAPANINMLSICMLVSRKHFSSGTFLFQHVNGIWISFKHLDENTLYWRSATNDASLSTHWSEITFAQSKIIQIKTEYDDNESALIQEIAWWIESMFMWRHQMETFSA